MSGSLTTTLPIPSSPMLDPTTGGPTQAWVRFFLALLKRTGGNIGTPGFPGGGPGDIQFNSSGAFGGLTNAELTTRIQIFTAALSGAVPASAGGTVDFLRADGVFAIPPGGGGGGSPGGTPGQVQFNNAGAFGGLSNTQLTALINAFTATLRGAVPPSGGGTTNFLRADGAFAIPPGSLVGFTSATDTALGVGAGALDNPIHTNVFLGANAGAVNTATRNTFIGFNSGKANTTGYGNVFVGNRSGYSNTTGIENMFIGYQAGHGNVSGKQNTCLGYYTGFMNVSGISNFFFGYEAGYSTTGNANLFLGTLVGTYCTTGSGNILIGYKVSTPTPTDSNKLNIGGAIKGDLVAGPIEIAKDLLLSTGNIILTSATSTPGASAGTLGNAPAAGNPQTWLRVSINGVVHFIPAWHV